MKGKFARMIVQRVMEMLAPAVCFGCGGEGAVLCEQCGAEAGLAVAQRCFRCGRATAAGATCGGCSTVTAIGGVSVGAAYEGAVKELVLALKFHRLTSAAQAAAELVVGSLPPGLEVDVVTAVPVSAARYRERGYNQSELIGRRVAKRLGLPYRGLLGRHTSEHQMGLDRRTRLERIRGAFYPLQHIEGRRVLLVDDVVTTGATLGECAVGLRAGGAVAVWGAAVARHQ